jgi:hypothetical protein
MIRRILILSSTPLLLMSLFANSEAQTRADEKSLIQNPSRRLEQLSRAIVGSDVVTHRFESCQQPEHSEGERTYRGGKRGGVSNSNPCAVGDLYYNGACYPNSGTAVGTASGNTAPGPVGTAVGGALGTAAGAATGTANPVTGTAYPTTGNCVVGYMYYNGSCYPAAAVGTASGNTAPGPVGTAVGGALGTAAGAATGTANPVTGTAYPTTGNCVVGYMYYNGSCYPAAAVGTATGNTAPAGPPAVGGALGTAAGAAGGTANPVIRHNP